MSKEFIETCQQLEQTKATCDLCHEVVNELTIVTLSDEFKTDKVKRVCESCATRGAAILVENEDLKQREKELQHQRMEIWHNYLSVA